jgi:hypothetical protein
MLGDNNGIFVQIPDETNERVLYPAIIVEHAEGVYTTEVEEPCPRLEAGQDLIVYFERRKQFMQQAARIEAVIADGGNGAPVFGFRLIGEPVSAESRQCYRTSTVMTELSAEFAEDGWCKLADVSPTGFAIITRYPHQIGEIVKARLQFGSDDFLGQVQVMSITKLGADRYRCGVRCLEDCNYPGTLMKGVALISSSVQRQQLRRLRGTG